MALGAAFVGETIEFETASIEHQVLEDTRMRTLVSFSRLTLDALRHWTSDPCWLYAYGAQHNSHENYLLSDDDDKIDCFGAFTHHAFAPMEAFLYLHLGARALDAFMVAVFEKKWSGKEASADDDESSMLRAYLPVGACSELDRDASAPNLLR